MRLRHSLAFALVALCVVAVLAWFAVTRIGTDSRGDLGFDGADAAILTDSGFSFDAASSGFNGSGRLVVSSVPEASTLLRLELGLAAMDIVRRRI